MKKGFPKMKKIPLRQGYTTGTCAQAATKAAMNMLLSGEKVESVQVQLPEGRILTSAVWDTHIYYEYAEEPEFPSAVSCAVKKDSGDDPDITNGVFVYSKVSWSDTPGIAIEGGEGIGRVTKPGLEQPIGAAAINRVPRRMIEKEVRDALEETEGQGGIRVEISIPGGEKLAAKTFNPRLGIVGGLSVLGTSGIVEPMSEQALVDTIHAELRVKLAEGRSILVITPGNYGLDFLKKFYGIEENEVVKCSNYIGQTIDMAAEEGCAGLVLTGHIGKLIKVSGGIMNTHSKWADCRMELFAAAALRAGIDGRRAGKLLKCVTMDDALDICTEAERREIMTQIMKMTEKHLKYRAGTDMKIGAVVYSNVYGILGKTSCAEDLIKAFCKSKTGERDDRKIIRNRSRAGRSGASYNKGSENHAGM